MAAPRSAAVPGSASAHLPAKDAGEAEAPAEQGAFPPRPAEAPSGSRFVEALLQKDEEGREEAILRELLRGNLPGSLRRLARVAYEGKTASGRRAEVTLWVTPDYLAVGDEADSVRVPMSPVTAQRLADAWGFVLPTAKVVDAVYAQAEVRLAPRTLTPNAWMVRTEAFVLHDALIDAQLAGRAPSGLVSGHKKDLVISKLLDARPHRLALYGWHTAPGHPIQPLCAVHGDWYSDYSHGVRLVAGTMRVDGRPRRVVEVLADADLAPLVSDEGPVAHARYRTEGGVNRKRWWPAIPPGEAPPPTTAGAAAARPGGG